MSSSTARVLVADNSEPFRRFVRSTVGEGAALEIVGEASNGLEAVRRAGELKPDLVLLDIGLPRLNGIEVARRIHKLCPESKILFVSQESSLEVLQEAFSLGWGYVAKTSAATDLLPAVEAVLLGRRFVSGT